MNINMKTSPVFLLLIVMINPSISYLNLDRNDKKLINTFGSHTPVHEIRFQGSSPPGKLCLQNKRNRIAFSVYFTMVLLLKIERANCLNKYWIFSPEKALVSTKVVEVPNFCWISAASLFPSSLGMDPAFFSRMSTLLPTRIIGGT